MSQQTPGSADAVAFTVRDEKLVGILYRPPGPGPHPAAVFLHGIPGSEKNNDSVYALREAGWQTLILHFRGAWGSGGRYDMRAQVDDALAALDWLLRPGNPYPVDPARLSLVGYSLGSRAALMAARDERVARVISIAGFATFHPDDVGRDFLDESATVLNGVSGEDLVRQWVSLGEGEQPVDAVAKLTCPLLVVHGDADEVVPVRNAHQLMQNAGPDAELALIPSADHLFSAYRKEIVETLVNGLTRVG